MCSINLHLLTYLPGSEGNNAHLKPMNFAAIHKIWHSVVDTAVCHETKNIANACAVN